MAQSESVRHNDVDRLFAAVGIDPSAYVSFRRPQVPARSNQLVKQCNGSNERVLREVSVDESSSFNGTKPPFPTDLDILRQQSDASRLMCGERTGAERSPAQMEKMREESAQVAMLSIAGGTGKTTLVLLLAKTLARRGHSILLADYSRYNAMHDLLGNPWEASLPVSLVSGWGAGSPLPLLSSFHEGKRLEDFDQWFELLAKRVHFAFLDGITDAVSTGLRLLDQGAYVMAPVLPEFPSAMSAIHLDKALNQHPRVTHVLNRFHVNRPQEVEVRACLRDSLGERLLPIEIGENPRIRQTATDACTAEDTFEPWSAQQQLRTLAEWLEMMCTPEGSGDREALR